MKFIKILSAGTLAVLSMASTISAKDYSGAELYTSETWMYGKFEARMKMAAVSGSVSSMFLYHNDSYLGGNEPWVEVDIEILGKNPGSFQSNIITGYGPGNGQPDRKVTSEKHHQISPASNEAFHTYGMEWTPDYVAWTLDGQIVRKTVKGQGDNNQVQDLGKKPQGLRFNLWSAEDAGWVGAFDDSKLPVYQFINWVKVYEYKPGQGENGSDFKLAWTDNFDSFDNSRWQKGDWTFDGNRVDISPSNIFTKDGMAIIALTKKGQEGFNGQVPKDNEAQPTSSSSSVTPPPSSSSVTPVSSSSSAVVPPSSSSDVVAIPQARTPQMQKHETRTFNAKGERVNNVRANDPRNRYRVNFKI